MQSEEQSVIKSVALVLSFVVLLLSTAAVVHRAYGALEQSVPVLDVNDVSFLWPVPKNVSDVQELISLNDNAADGKIFSDELLAKLMDEAKTVHVGGAQIRLPDEAKFKDPVTWKVAGIRVNPSALGSDVAVLQRAGVVPGIRLIVQPLTIDGNKVVIHDFAAHVVFDYLIPHSDGKLLPPFQPDNDAFAAVVTGLRDLKTFAQNAGVRTSKQPLGVHPALAKGLPGFTDQVRLFLKTHLSRKRLHVVSFMGIPGQFEPWIFFKVTVNADNTLTRESVSGNFDNPSETAQMLSFAGGPVGQVQPAPAPNPAAIQRGFGVSTSLLFRSDVAKHLNDNLFPGATLPIPPQLKLRDVADAVANPQRYHTANADCVSCHTETTRRKSISGLVSQPGVAFKQPPGISAVSPAVLPKDKWNLRNFGWGLAFFENRTFKPTITQRAANEAAESTQIINHGPLSVPPIAQPIAENDVTPLSNR